MLTAWLVTMEASMHDVFLAVNEKKIHFVRFLLRPTNKSNQILFISYI